MFEYIKDAGLKPARPYTKRGKTNLVLVHHVEGEMTVQAIHNMHIAKGNKGIDYNIYIGLDGAAYWGRGLEYEGGSVSNSYSKTAGMNARAVAIVCNGNFNKRTMPDAQFNMLCRVVADVCGYYGISVADVISHKEAAGSGYTDCPGTNFPMAKLREYLKNGGSGSMNYVTTRTAEIYRRDSDRKTIGAGNELELLEYSGGKWALVKNPKTGNEFIVEWAALGRK